MIADVRERGSVNVAQSPAGAVLADYAGFTFSARGPFGPWPRSNVTAWPSRMLSKGVLVHADWWKKYSLPSWAATNPKPLSLTIRLIVPLTGIVSPDLLWNRRSDDGCGHNRVCTETDRIQQPDSFEADRGPAGHDGVPSAVGLKAERYPS
jgi:hypothetical protein